jgi:hypothetical protein
MLHYHDTRVLIHQTEPPLTPFLCVYISGIVYGTESPHSGELPVIIQEVISHVSERTAGKRCAASQPVCASVFSKSIII